MLEDEEALVELLPKGLRRRLGPLAPKLGALGVARTRRKYGGDLKDLEAHRREAIAVLDEIRAQLKKGDGRTLLGRFTFADIAIAQALVFIEPPATGLRLGEASRRSFSDSALREAYGDLLAWRDALYAEYRAA